MMNSKLSGIHQRWSNLGSLLVQNLLWWLRNTARSRGVASIPTEIQTGDLLNISQ